MRIASRLSAALLLLLAVGLAVPAHATTRALNILVSGPVAPDADVPMIGTGCSDSDPVSLDVWNTADPSSHLLLNDVTTAPSSGNFGYLFHLNNQFDPGAEIGFYFSCTATVDWTWDPSTTAARTKYVETTDPNPHVTIEAQATSTYGTSVQVVATTEVANGTIALTVDGVTVPLDTVDENGDGGTDVSHIGWWLFHLPVRLAAGTHSLHATWTPSAAGSSTVTDDATLRVRRRTPTVGLRLSPTSVRRGNTVAARVSLGSTGVAARVGRVVIKSDGHIVARGRLGAADNGVRIFALWIRALGRHHITAVFLGSATLNRATSPTRTLSVHR